MSAPATCAWCRFWQPLSVGGGRAPLAQAIDIDSTPLGECRRYPPEKASADGLAFWPEATAAQWCGEFVIDPVIAAPKA